MHEILEAAGRKNFRGRGAFPAKSRSAAEGFSRPRGLPRKIPQANGRRDFRGRPAYRASGGRRPEEFSWPPGLPGRGLPRAYCMDSKNSMPLLSAVRVTTAFFQLAV